MDSEARPERAVRAFASPTVRQWERENTPPWQLAIEDAWARHGAGVRTWARVVLVASAVVTVVAVARRLGEREELAEEAARLRDLVTAREGELRLVRLELDRLERVFERSSEHRIPVDLAAQILDVAEAEGIATDLAFSLVRVESNFVPEAVSTAGAVGLTQVMPMTAAWLQPGVAYRELFEGDTNLRLGFRYLRYLLGQYEGDLRLALLAYNRGPTRVDSIRTAGGDPANGYAAAVLRGARRRGASMPRRRYPRRGASTSSTSVSAMPTISPSGNSTRKPSVAP